MLPFTVEQFFTVFADYNQSVWPVQWLLRAVAISILLLSISRVAWRDRAICLLLGGLWAWMAVAYHLIHFATINPAAYVFAAFFLTQAALFLWRAMSNRSLKLAFRLDFRSVVGIAMVAYALIAYPVLNAWLGHAYPSTPTFGAPCPTTIFTLGVLTIARERRASLLLIVPLLWSVVGGSAAFLLGVWQDLGLLASAVTAAAVIGVDRIRTRS
jgi:hypothetical protein